MNSKPCLKRVNGHLFSKALYMTSAQSFPIAGEEEYTHITLANIVAWFGEVPQYLCIVLIWDVLGVQCGLSEAVPNEMTVSYTNYKCEAYLKVSLEQ